ncbi:MAG: DUF1573 domain-containing protein [Gimesia sp.]
MRNQLLHSKWARPILLTLATLPFITAGYAHLTGSQVQKSMAGEPKPALAFETYLVDKGLAKETDRTVSARFRFKNLSKQTVTVKELVPSCGCLNPRLKKRVYLPNEIGEFQLRMETAGESPGQKEYFVDFKYEDTKERSTRLTFKLELPIRRLIVRPRALVIYQFTPGRTTHPITVSDYRPGTDFKIISVRSDTKYARAELGSLDIKAGLRQQKLDVIVEDRIPPGKHSGMIIITTNDKDFPELYVPLIIQGPDQKTAQKETPVSPQAN